MWDLKPGHDNGGPFKEIDTTAPGLKIGEHLPKLAKHGDRLAVLRGMSTKEGDHGRGTYLMRTGNCPAPRASSTRARRARVEGTRRREGRAAELRQHRAAAVLRAGRVRPRLPRPGHAPLIVGENQNFDNPQGNGIDSDPEGRGPRPAEGDRRRDRRGPARPAPRDAGRVRRRPAPARSPRATPPPTTAPSG